MRHLFKDQKYADPQPQPVVVRLPPKLVHAGRSIAKPATDIIAALPQRLRIYFVRRINFCQLASNAEALRAAPPEAPFPSGRELRRCGQA